jgi:hypothetical protein
MQVDFRVQSARCRLLADIVAKAGFEVVLTASAAF